MKGGSRMRLIGIICVSVLVLALAIPAFAETQQVKVSGDLTFRGVHRSYYDLNDADMGDDDADFFMSTVELQVDADLTDNVSTVVRLVNQRNWGDSDYPTQYHTAAAPWAVGAVTNAWSWKHRLTEVGVDLAYVTLKEMIFEPLTIRVGRQNLFFGRGFIIGANQVDPGFIQTQLHGAVNMFPFHTDQRGIGSPEFTAYEAFDAARATIDFEKYAPFVVDVVYAKINEGAIQEDMDVDLYGVNAGYMFDVYNAEAEAYLWYKNDESSLNPTINSDDMDKVYTIGTRGSFEPTSEWAFAGELAYQFGQYVNPAGQVGERDRAAWATDLVADYKGWLDYTWSPRVGLEYVYWSGDHDVDQQGGTYQGWDRMFTRYFTTAIRPFQGIYYMTDRHPTGADEGLTNQHQLVVNGSIQPLDDLTFEAKAAQFWFAEQPDGRMNGKANKAFGDIGSEVDLLTTYDYTEDVTLSLLTAWFFPGEHYDSPDRLNDNIDLSPKVATEIVGSMKVSF